MMSSRMILLPVSRHVAQPHPHWPEFVHPTGYWFPRLPEGWVPPQDLLDFFGKSDKPIAVSLGVMNLSGKQAREGARIVLQTIAQTGVRAIVQGWDEALQGCELPSQIYHAGPLPHGWLFDLVEQNIRLEKDGVSVAVRAIESLL
jgi:sterol 3beta-glucosyltransferase